MTDKRVVLVTGGAAGIGEAVCQRLAADGMAVGVADINEAEAQRVATSINDAGGEAMALRMDISDQASVDAGIEALVGRFGHLNYLVANAGIFVYGDFDTFSEGDFAKIMSVNVDGTLFCCRSAVRQMLAQGEQAGPYSIVITTSEGSFSQDPPSGAYITSKWAERGLMRSLARTLEPHGITVNGVGPGSVYTALHKYVNERFAEMNHMDLDKATELFAKVRPVRGYQPAEEVAACFSYLLSDAARHVSGITLMDNGGHVMA